MNVHCWLLYTLLWTELGLEKKKNKKSIWVRETLIFLFCKVESYVRPYFNLFLQFSSK